MISGRLQRVLKFAVPVIVFFLGSLLADRILGFMGYPREVPPRVAHPPNYSELRENVEFTYEFKTNSQGLRSREIPLSKSENELRFVVVGDSFTEGYGVEAEATYCAVLERNLSKNGRKVRFVNCGLTGTAPLEYARVLLHVGLNYDPDGVLIALYADDVSGTQPHSKEALARSIEDPGQEQTKAGWKRIVHAAWPRVYTMFEARSMRSRHQTHVRSVNFVETLSNRARRMRISEKKIRQWQKAVPSDLVRAVEQEQFNGMMLAAGLFHQDYWTESLDIHNKAAEVKWKAMTNVLEMMVQHARDRDLPVAILFIPAFFQYEAGGGGIWGRCGVHIRDEWLREKTELEKRLHRWAELHQVPMLNLTPVFRKAVEQASKPLIFPLDGHWTEQGHEVAASAIEKWLGRLGWLPETPYQELEGPS